MIDPIYGSFCYQIAILKNYRISKYPRRDFLMTNFFLLETKIDLDCCTKFKINLILYEEELADQEKMKLAITKTHVLEEICSFVKQWVKQIMMVRECYHVFHFIYFIVI